MSDARYVGVVVEAPLTTVYHYRIAEPLIGRVALGMRVTAPFGPRRIKGFAVSLHDDPPAEIEEKRIRDILDVGRGEVLAGPDILKLTRWIADYYHAGWGEVLAAAVPGAVRKGTKEKTILHVALAVEAEEARQELALLVLKAPKQAAILQALLEAGRELTMPELQELTGATSAVARGLEKKGLVMISSAAVHRELVRIGELEKELTLTEGQANAVSAITASLDVREYAVYLMHGATASGKTEVYLRALERCLAQGRSGIVLVPEISLTPQTVERFRARVGHVAVLHSNLSDGERAEAWRKLKNGEVRVAIGARSAIFAPMPDLGLIVVDEEHERTFKQDSTPRYNARDASVVRARDCNAVVLLGSATPCLESYNNVKNGKYRLLELPHRVGSGRLPETLIVDMRQEFGEVQKEILFSRRLERGIQECIARGEQVILFLNRRGFNTWIHCLHCTSVIECPNCEISLTHHRYENLLRCHYCDYHMAVPKVCPDCSAERLRFAGSGTERVEDVLAKIVPQAKVLRMDSDTMTTRESYATALGAFARREYDILLGTQMIAKGLDFANVTLIGVLAADGSINLPDFRAAEHTFQLITQVVGRAGRGERPGVGIIQAYNPEHYAIQLAAKQDYLDFVDHEFKDRKSLRYPPFGRLARILVRGPDAGACHKYINDVAMAVRKVAPPLSVLGPVPCSLKRIQANFRFHFLIKGKDAPQIQKILHTVREHLVDKGKMKLIIDVDPVSLL
ncbi:MAG: replication restart helicase PriA [Planctomycetota bacterium]|jgi:primosomal protein N' (replication factor Y)